MYILENKENKINDSSIKLKKPKNNKENESKKIMKGRNNEDKGRNQSNRKSEEKMNSD